MIRWVGSEKEYWWICYDGNGQRIASAGSHGELSSFGEIRNFDSRDSAVKFFNKNYSDVEMKISEGKQIPKEGQNMLKETAADFKAFMHDHRNIIFWLALAFLADHFFFGGAFRARLNAMVEKMIGRVEKQIEAQ